MSKDFKEELSKFIDKVKAKENFALIRFADGEGSIVDNNPEWLRRRRRSSRWEHIIGNKEHEDFRSKLTAALTYNSPNFYIGIPCKQAHQARFHYLFDFLKEKTTCPEEQLTFATVFKDFNWQRFLKEFVPACTERDCYLVANDFSKPPKEDWLKFKHTFPVPMENAHLHVNKNAEEILNYIRTNDIKDSVFLFCAGPASNVLIHTLWKECPHNSYIDIGSTLDNFLFKHSSCRGKSRVYIRKNGNGYRPWEWG